MPHYANGEKAAIGHVVKGKGYNLRGADGELREFVGEIVGLTPNSESCNIQVAYIWAKEAPADFANWSGLYDFFSERGVIGCGPNGGTDNTRVMARLGLEYGQCDHFVRVA